MRALSTLRRAAHTASFACSELNTLASQPVAGLGPSSSALALASTGRSFSAHQCSRAAKQSPQPAATHGFSLEEDPSCWSCSHNLQKGGLVCQGCEKVQPVNPAMDYFQVFSM